MSMSDTDSDNDRDFDEDDENEDSDLDVPEEESSERDDEEDEEGEDNDDEDNNDSSDGEEGEEDSEDQEYSNENPDMPPQTAADSAHSTSPLFARTTGKNSGPPVPVKRSPSGAPVQINTGAPAIRGAASLFLANKTSSAGPASKTEAPPPFPRKAALPLFGPAPAALPSQVGSSFDNDESNRFPPGATEVAAPPIRSVTKKVRGAAGESGVLGRKVRTSTHEGPGKYNMIKASQPTIKIRGNLAVVTRSLAEKEGAYLRYLNPPDGAGPEDLMEDLALFYKAKGVIQA